MCFLYNRIRKSPINQRFQVGQSLILLVFVAPHQSILEMQGRLMTTTIPVLPCILFLVIKYIMDIVKKPAAILASL